MSDSPCIDALIEFKKTVRDRWSGEIESAINRAFHHGYAAGREPDDATIEVLKFAKLVADSDSWSKESRDTFNKFLKAWDWTRENKN